MLSWAQSIGRQHGIIIVTIHPDIAIEIGVKRYWLEAND